MSVSIEESKGDKYHHGTHDYPDPLEAITQDEWDVVIVGAGPAGLMTAASLARFGGHRVLVVDERSEPTTAGRADGIQPRTIEVFRNMEPLGSEFVTKSAGSYERSFWDPRSDGSRGIERTKRVQSFPYNMEIQDNCTLGLQQGLIEGAYLRDMEKHGQKVHRPWGYQSFKFVEDATYPVEITLEKMQPVVETTNEGGAPMSVIKGTGEKKVVRSKYLVGCDGGRSKVRTTLESRNQVTFDGDWVDTLWAALDCTVETDFPDVRKIAAIHSEKHGALYIFPRENNADGEPIIRCYTQVNRMAGEKSKVDAREMRDKVTAEMVMQAVNEIAHPYKFDFKTVEWFTCYPIGQRLVSRYSLPAGTQEDGVKFEANRIFMCGDACHTHSPKAGQGMNTAIIDAQALSWRINLVEKGLADRQALLSTYHDERHKTGKQLIDFDSEYSALFSGEIPKTTPELKGASAEELKVHFFNVQRRNAAFTTGAGVLYDDNVLNYRDPSPLGLSKAVTNRLEPGRRLLPAWATRWISSTPVRIIHEVQFTAPGGFRLYVCGGKLSKNASKLEAFGRYLSSDASSFLQRFQANRAPTLRHGAYHERPPALNSGLKGFTTDLNPYFHLLLIVSANRFNFEPKDVANFGPLKSWLYADDAEPHGDKISDEDGDESIGGLQKKWGIGEEGGIVVCRPDGYVGVVVPLEERGWKALEKYFDGFLTSSTTSKETMSQSQQPGGGVAPRVAKM